MTDFLISSLAMVITLPFPFLFLFYFFARKWYRHKQKALHQSVTVTAPIFIVSVHVLLFVLFERSFFAYIIIMLLLLLALSVVIQYKVHDEIRLFKAIKSFWRLSFLLFFAVYSSLSLFGLINRMFFS